LDSDEQVDVLNELDDDDVAAILDKMDPEEADDVRERVKYSPDTAGGLMITEYLSFPKDTKVADVLADLRAHVEDYQEYDVRYIYVVESRSRPKLKGVVRLKDIVLSPGNATLMSLRLLEAKSVPVVADLDDLEHFFDRYDFSATPVVDWEGNMVGTVLLSDVQEAVGERADKTFMRFGGIITGEELRTMPTVQRALRRLAFLLPVFLLSLASASVIGLFEATIKDVTVLAMFLPLVAGLSGCSGNQAVAVSVRELALGLATKGDVIRVLFKELAVGVSLGVCMGSVLFGVALLWSGSVSVGLTVGMAVPMTIMIAVCLGGVVPLMLTAFKVDPAMASGPLVTTMTDFCSFFSVLMIATHVFHMHGG
jgi:magnesium transporter